MDGILTSRNKITPDELICLKNQSLKVLKSTSYFLPHLTNQTKVR